MKELATIQAELKAPKDLYNKFGKYNYRSAESILEALKPLLSAQKCHLTITDDIVLVGERYYIKATATVSNGTESVSAVAFAREEDTKKGMDSSQLTGSTSSYARKYALNGLFAIDDNKDSDDTNKHGMDSDQKPTVDKDKVAPKKLAIPASVKKAIESATTRDELVKIWNANPNLKSLQEFIDLFQKNTERVGK